MISVEKMVEHDHLANEIADALEAKLLLHEDRIAPQQQPFSPSPSPKPGSLDWEFAVVEAQVKAGIDPETAIQRKERLLAFLKTRREQLRLEKLAMMEYCGMALDKQPYQWKCGPAERREELRRLHRLMGTHEIEAAKRSESACDCSLCTEARKKYKALMEKATRSCSRSAAERRAAKKRAGGETEKERHQRLSRWYKGE